MAKRENVAVAPLAPALGDYFAGPAFAVYPGLSVRTRRWDGEYLGFMIEGPLDALCAAGFIDESMPIPKGPRAYHWLGACPDDAIKISRLVDGRLRVLMKPARMAASDHAFRRFLHRALSP